MGKGRRLRVLWMQPGRVKRDRGVWQVPKVQGSKTHQPPLQYILSYQDADYSLILSLVADSVKLLICPIGG